MELKAPLGDCEVVADGERWVLMSRTCSECTIGPEDINDDECP